MIKSLKFNLAAIFWLFFMMMSFLKQGYLVSPFYMWSNKFMHILFWMSMMLWIFYIFFNLTLSIPLSWVMILGILMIPFFSSNQFWWMVFWFEFSLLPIMMIIIGFGVQSVRFPAALYMMVYTLVFSLPSIALILYSDWNYLIFSPSMVLSKISFFAISFMFMVKIPVFGFHLWLPKAHVESPTLGSMVLAGVLLKMGVFGFWMISNWGQSKMQLIWFLWGGALASFMAVIQSDLKRIIAFSSVAHLNLALASGLSYSLIGESSLLLLSLLHGAISSILFMLVGVSSFLSKSRLLFFLKINFSSFWLLTLAFNMSLPPCPSFWPEFFSGLSLGLYSIWGLILFFAGGVSLAWFTILNWLSLKLLSFQNLNLLSKTQFSFLWITFILWFNLCWFI